MSKQKISMEIPNTAKIPADGSLYSSGPRFYMLMALMYHKGTIRPDGFGGAGRVRNVKAQLVEGAMKRVIKHDAALVKTNIVAIPLNKSIQVTIELDIPDGTPAGDYTVRVLQVPADPETKTSVISMPDFENEADRKSVV